LLGGTFLARSVCRATRIRELWRPVKRRERLVLTERERRYCFFVLCH